MDIPATCPDENWSPEYNRYFTGKIVVLFASMPDVARQLLPEAKKVSVVELPGDIGNCTRDQLLKLIDEAPPFTAETLPSTSTNDSPCPTPTTTTDITLPELAELLSNEVKKRLTPHTDALNTEIIRAELLLFLRQYDLKKLGLPSPSKFVDAAMATVKAEVASNTAHKIGPIIDTPACEGEVDGQQLLEKISNIFNRYVILPKGACVALTLWVLFTYALDVFDFSPILALLSPTKRCGKTTLLTILTHLTHWALPTSNISTAALFRAVDRWRPTLLIDEFDSFGGVKEDLRGVLNSGHKKSHAFITRSVGHRHEPKLFSTWCPKSLALIDGKIETAGLASTLRDRSIIIHMRRKTKAEHVDRFREQDVVSEFAEVRSQLVRWSQDHLTEIDAAYRAKINTPSGLNDRQINNWEPLLALAAVVAGEWPKLAYEAAQILSSDMDDDDEAQASGVELLHDVRTIFNRAPSTTQFIPATDLLFQLLRLEDSPWAQFRNGKPLTAHQLGRMLRKFRIRSQQTWVSGGGTGQNLKAYYRASFQDTWDRYLPPDESARSARTKQNQQVKPDFESDREPLSSAPKNEPKSNKRKRSSGSRTFKAEKNGKGILRSRTKRLQKRSGKR